MLLQNSATGSARTGRVAGAVETAAPARSAERRYALDQREAPYVDAITEFGDSDPLSLMVPGHGHEAATGAEHLAELFGARAPQLDVPMMLETIDLGDRSALVRSQELAADAWGAKRTWFLTNGASQANRTAAIAVRGLGERILIQRAMHSSLTDGVLLSGLAPAFVSPSVDTKHGISHGLTPDALEAALIGEARAGRPVSSVYVVSPSYFGAVADVENLARVSHEHGAAIIVDNAWAPHFGFHDRLPESPARLGADLVVSSTHKLGGSFTQSAMLHLGDGPFARRLEPLVERAFRMTASTSMSSLLMGSLDATRRALAIGEERIAGAIRQADEMRRRLRAHPSFTVISDAYDRFPDIVGDDPLHIPIDVSALERSGHWVRGELARSHGIYMELSTASCVVAVIGALRDVDLERFMTALDAVVEEARRLGPETADVFPELPTAGPMRVLPRDAYFAASEVVPAEEAIGRISADSLAAYPPGIPNALPGEEITAETVSFLRAVAASPTGYVRGAVDAAVSRIRVLANS